jgi:hypothetical protein
MATRFRKHRTRKMKHRKPLKTRRQKGSGVLNTLTGFLKGKSAQNSGTLKIRVPPNPTPNSLLTPPGSPRTPNSLGNNASTITDSPRNRLGSMNSGISIGSVGSTGSRRSTGANVGRLIQINMNAQQRYKNKKAALNAQIKERNRQLEEQVAKEQEEAARQQVILKQQQQAYRNKLQQRAEFEEKIQKEGFQKAIQEAFSKARSFNEEIIRELDDQKNINDYGSVSHEFHLSQFKPGEGPLAIVNGFKVKETIDGKPYYKYYTKYEKDLADFRRKHQASSIQGYRGMSGNTSARWANWQRTKYGK